jgi:uncharacterized membrane protein
LYGELYAIATAFLRGFAVVPIRRGLKHSNPNTSAFIFLVINTLVLWFISALIYPLKEVASNGFEYFILAGLVGPGIPVIFRDIGINRLGITITSPIVSTSTFFSMLIAITFLGEKITSLLLMGVFLIFVGINILTWQTGSRRDWKKKDLIFPVISAILFSISVSLRKVGLLQFNYPVMGAAITSSFSLINILSTLLFSKIRNIESWKLDLNREAIKFFGVSGFAMSVAFGFYFLALSSSYLVKIQPIAGTNPLFAMIASFIFLRDVEDINFRVILGTIITVFGIILITL